MGAVEIYLTVVSLSLFIGFICWLIRVLFYYLIWHQFISALRERKKRRKKNKRKSSGFLKGIIFLAIGIGVIYVLSHH